MKSSISLLAGGLFAASLTFLAALPAAAQSPQPQQFQQTNTKQQGGPYAQAGEGDCNWWRFGHCPQQDQVEGLPPDAPRRGTLITVDVGRNMLYLFKDGQLVDKSRAATGMNKTLRKNGKVYAFYTPRGLMKVQGKIVDPVWRKPDWAFIEAGDPIPPPDSPKRLVKDHLGKYALTLGDGIMIHGTDEYDSIGRKASHGCIRLPEDMLETVYKAAKVGTPVYVFDSHPQQTATVGKAERHSDLD